MNQRLDPYDENIAELGRKLDKNNSDTRAILIDNKRNSIIDFASLMIDKGKTVTKEQFNRIFKIYEEYEVLIKANGMTNGEVEYKKWGRISPAPFFRQNGLLEYRIVTMMTCLFFSSTRERII